jgi:hypothetical protein
VTQRPVRADLDRRAAAAPLRNHRWPEVGVDPARFCAEKLRTWRCHDHQEWRPAMRSNVAWGEAQSGSRAGGDAK